jgi:hypothetical protein
MKLFTTIVVVIAATACLWWAADTYGGVVYRTEYTQDTLLESTEDSLFTVDLLTLDTTDVWQSVKDTLKEGK